MRLVLYFLAVCLAAAMYFENNDDAIKVEIREIPVEDEGKRTKRRVKMAKKKMFEFDLNNVTIKLDLTLNEFVKDTAPMYVVENGDLKMWERENTEEQYAFYQDPNTMASVMMMCKFETCKPLGTFSVKGKRYRLHLNEIQAESRLISFLTPIGDPPKMMLCREGNLVILTMDPSKHVCQNESQVITPPSQPQQQSSRKQRAIPAGTDIVEIMVYTDEVISNRFITLNNGNKSAGLEATRFYYALLVNEMDSLFQPFKTHLSNTAGLDIRLFFSGIVISCVSKTANWSGSDDSAFEDIVKFSSWQSTQKNKYRLKYDIAMGISGKITDSVGIAYRETICDSVLGTSIMYDTPSYTVLLTSSAFLLGTNLGADIDIYVGCPSGYIMTPTLTSATSVTALTQYQFSDCSVRDIQSKLIGLGSPRCTLDYNFNDTEYDQYRAGAIGGDVLSLTYQCQVYFGNASFGCLIDNSTMCYSGVTCQTSTGCNGVLQLVKEHTECSEGKWCVKGECVNKTSSGTNAPGNCFIYRSCIRRRLPRPFFGDGCCQGRVRTNCCVLRRFQRACHVCAPG